MIFQRKLSHRSSTVFSTALSFGLLLLGASLLFSAEARATEWLYVLPAGGTNSLERLAIADGPSGVTLSRGEPFTLTLTQGGIAAYTDLVVLPGGHLLLGDGSGRGAVIFDEGGVQVDSIFGPLQMVAPSSVVVATYLTANRPELLLMGDNTTGRVQLYDLVSRTYAWSHTLMREGVRGRIQRAVALPDSRVAVAVTWPALSLSAVKVLTMDNPAAVELAIFSTEVSDHPEAIVLQGLHPVRDLSADVDARLLITSAERISMVDGAGQLLSQAARGEVAGISGEFQSARWLASDRVVAATRQPGQWNTPHTNHRIHLLDFDAEEILVATSAAMDAAPLRLEVAAGQGGTGTRDYYSDALEPDPFDISDLVFESDPHLSPRQIARDESAFLQFTLLNRGERTLLLRRLELRIGQGTCYEEVDPETLTFPWWTRSNREIYPDDPLVFNDSVFPLAEMATGPWCGQLFVTSRNGSRYPIGEALDFEIFPPAGPSDRPVRVDDLADFEDGDDETGDAEPGLDDDAGAEGCVCSTSPGAPSPSFLLVLAGLLLWARRGRLKTADENDAPPFVPDATRRASPPAR